MSEREALLRAIRESPGDDSPRLVYADWLDEAGESARAEFVRVQIELARRRDFTSPTPPSPVADFAKWTTTQLAERETVLLGLHQDEWRRECPAPLYHQGDFERGFVESFVIDRPDVIFQVSHSIAFFDATPGRTLALRNLYELPPETIDYLINDDLFAHVEHLVIGPGAHLVGEALLALTSHPARMPHLRRLSLRGCAVLTAPLSESLAPPLLRQLTHLELRDAHLNDRDIADLSRLEFGTLLELDLSDNQIDDDGLIALARSPSFGNLRSLRLTYNLFGPVGVTALAKSPLMNRLVAVDVTGCENVDANAAWVLLDRPKSSPLRHIEVAETAVPMGLRTRLAESIGEPVPETTDDGDVPPDGLARYLPHQGITHPEIPLLFAFGLMLGVTTTLWRREWGFGGEPMSLLDASLLTTSMAMTGVTIAMSFQSVWVRRSAGRSRWAVALAAAWVAGAFGPLWGSGWLRTSAVTLFAVAAEVLVLSLRSRSETDGWHLSRRNAVARWAVVALLAGLATAALDPASGTAWSSAGAVGYVVLRALVVPRFGAMIRQLNNWSFGTYHSAARNDRFLDAAIPAAVGGVFLTLAATPFVPKFVWTTMFLGVCVSTCASFGAAFLWGNPSPLARRSQAVDAAFARRSRDCRWPCLAIVVACLALLWLLPRGAP